MLAYRVNHVVTVANASRQAPKVEKRLRREWSPDETAQAIEMRVKSKMTWNAIGVRIGRDRGCVKVHLNARGIL